MTLDIVPATDIDYSNIDAICGYQLLLCKLFERAGGFDYPPVTNATIREVQKQGSIWLRKVRFFIADILDGKVNDLAAMPDLIIAYDFFYRVCNGTPCYDYLREVKLKTVDHWLKGDKSISDTDVVLLLLSETDRDIRSLEKRYSDFAFSALGEWIDELTRYGRFIDIPLAEAYKRLTYILKDDLFAYLGRKEKQDAAKMIWTQKYALENPCLLDTRTLLRYIGFILTANQRGYYTSEPEDDLYCHLWSDYISRPEVNSFFREALDLDLTKYAIA